ncbi:hypothetical protein [Massilia sp. Se16.2.3]|uniref:hypothetical protein n=1 Tax=Massilia sp. Se16.2.3 TaxID=2709303 RepID=UPI0035A627ED
MSGLNPLSRWLLLGEWRAHPVRALLAVVAIAVGVAMGFAIHLINAAAFNEFSSAIKSLSGQADVQVHGREALFDETVYPRLARYEGVAIASPVLELQAAVPKARGALRLVGIDALRAPYIAPDLLGVPSDGRAGDLLDDRSVFLSPAAQAWLGTRSGGELVLRAGTRDFALRVAGPVQRARPGQRFGVMDIGALQWRFGQLGKLSRVDLKLRPGVNRGQFQARLAADLGGIFPGASASASRTTANSKAATTT